MTEAYKRILAATDGTELATRAVEHAAMLVRSTGAHLVLVTVTPPPPTFDAAEIGWSVPANIYDEFKRADAATAKTVLSAAADAAGIDPEQSIHVAGQDAFEGILETNDKVGADLIVMGSHGRRGLDRLIIGSQALKVLSLSKIPVLIVK